MGQVLFPNLPARTNSFRVISCEFVDRLPLFFFAAANSRLGSLSYLRLISLLTPCAFDIRACAEECFPRSNVECFQIAAAEGAVRYSVFGDRNELQQRARRSENVNAAFCIENQPQGICLT